jgi:hypothetical protein
LRAAASTPGAAAEIDLVEVEFQDLVLGELVFQRQRDQRLLGLAAEGAIVVEEDGARNCCVSVDPPCRQRPFCART